MRTSIAVTVIVLGTLGSASAAAQSPQMVRTVSTTPLTILVMQENKPKSMARITVGDSVNATRYCSGYSNAEGRFSCGAVPLNSTIHLKADATVSCEGSKMRQACEQANQETNFRAVKATCRLATPTQPVTSMQVTVSKPGPYQPSTCS